MYRSDEFWFKSSNLILKVMSFLWYGCLIMDLLRLDSDSIDDCLIDDCLIDENDIFLMEI